VVDVLQTPCLPLPPDQFHPEVARQGRPVNIKKGQFLAPWDMANVVAKARASATTRSWSASGRLLRYNNLVSDMRALASCAPPVPVVFDATHSVQLPGGQGQSSGGQREFVPVLARAAVAVVSQGCSWRPTRDRTRPSATAQRLAAAAHRAPARTLVEIDRLVKAHGFAEQDPTDGRRRQTPGPDRPLWIAPTRPPARRRNSHPMTTFPEAADV